MKKIKYILLTMLILQAMLSSEVVNSIVGVVGALPITKEDFVSRRDFLTIQARGYGVRITDDQVYKDLIEERVMMLKLAEFNYEIEERDVDKRMELVAKQFNVSAEEFARLLSLDGISYDEYRTTMKKQITMENLYQVVANAPEVTDSEADAFYASTKNKELFEGDTAVKLAWIFFKASTFAEKGEKEPIAQRVRGEASRGRDFATLARQHSEDASKNSGGDLGYHLLGDLGTRTMSAQVAFGLNMVKNGSKAGAVSTVRESVGRGFWIVKVVDVLKDEVSIRSRVKSYLYEQRIQDAFTKWLDEEVKRVSVTLYK